MCKLLRDELSAFFTEKKKDKTRSHCLDPAVSKVMSRDTSVISMFIMGAFLYYFSVHLFFVTICPKLALLFINWVQKITRVLCVMLC